MRPFSSRQAALLCAFLTLPTAAQSGVCEVVWDGDSVARGIAGRPTYLRVPLKHQQQYTADVTVGQVQAFSEAKERVSRAAGLSPRFIICGEGAPNAFAAPTQNGDVVGVTVGMLRMADGDRDMAAAVIGHEIAHRTHRHGENAVARTALIDLAAIILGIAVDSRQQRRSGVPSTVGVNVARLGGALISRKFDRDQEREADELGFQYMVSAGYDPSGAVRLANRMNQLGFGGAGLFFDSHPGWSERAERFQNFIAGSTQAQQLVARGGAPAPVVAGTTGTSAAMASTTPTATQATSFAARDSQALYARYTGVQFPHVPVPGAKDNTPKGKWSFQAHQAVKEYQKCYAETVALENTGDGIETYAIACHDNTRHEVRCDLAKCVAAPKEIRGG